MSSYKTIDTLKYKCHHFDEIFVIACYGSCQSNNFLMEVVKVTTSIEASDENVTKMANLPFRCM